MMFGDIQLSIKNYAANEEAFLIKPLSVDVSAKDCNQKAKQESSCAIKKSDSTNYNSVIKSRNLK